MNRPHPSGGLRPAGPQEKHSGRTDRPSPRGSPEGSPPPLGQASRSGGCAPSFQNNLRGRAGGPNSRSHRRETVLPAIANLHKLPSSLRRTKPPLPRRPPPQANAAMPLPPPPIPSHPTIPYPTPMHTHTRPTAIVLPAQAGEPRRLPPPTGAAAQRRKLRVQGLPCQGVGAGPALPCFPLSISGHLSPRPSASVRLAPCQIRLVPLFRPFQHPPAGPSAPHPVHAWQIRLVSLCRLVRRASIPSCTASLQARAAGKSRAHHSSQFKPNPPPPPNAP